MPIHLSQVDSKVVVLYNGLVAHPKGRAYSYLVYYQFLVRL